MYHKYANQVFLLSSLAIGICLYWPSLNGEPIWDDLGLWFFDPAMSLKYNFSNIWKDSSWPLTMSFQKLTFELWGFNFRNYHVTSLFVHLLNSLLVFQLGRILKWPFYKWIFLFFLFHPANVITVSWMIQVKTLLCFLFAILSFMIFIKALKEKKWYPLAWALFFLSVTSKSASILLPVVFVIYALKEQPRKQFMWLIPFFIISLGATYRLMSSDITRETTVELDHKNLINHKTLIGSNDKIVPSGIEVKPDANKVSENAIEKIVYKLLIANKTAKYYFWKSLVPINNGPVKARYATGFDLTDCLHLIFIFTICILFRKTSLIIILAASFILMLPLMGIIVAPYMNITLVSDQHSYLLLPFLLLFWFTLLHKIPSQKRFILPALFLPFFLYEVNRTIPYYSDDIAFYSASLKADPTNLAMIHNLAATYAMKGEIDKALEVGKNIENTKDSNNAYFKDVQNLIERLEKIKARQK